MKHIKLILLLSSLTIVTPMLQCTIPDGAATKETIIHRGLDKTFGPDSTYSKVLNRMKIGSCIGAYVGLVVAFYWLNANGVSCSCNH